MNANKAHGFTETDGPRECDPSNQERSANIIEFNDCMYVVTNVISLVIQSRHYFMK